MSKAIKLTFKCGHKETILTSLPANLIKVLKKGKLNQLCTDCANKGA